MRRDRSSGADDNQQPPGFDNERARLEVRRPRRRRRRRIVELLHTAIAEQSEHFAEALSISGIR